MLQYLTTIAVTVATACMLPFLLIALAVNAILGGGASGLD